MEEGSHLSPTRHIWFSSYLHITPPSPYTQELGCDWLVASGHKMCAPTGIGFLWGKYELLDESPPWQGGGEMIDQVTFGGLMTDTMIQ